MPFAKAKVYFDGSHYIAIPHTVRKKKAKKKTAVKKVSPELEEMDEDETTPFDECTQMSIFDLEKKTEKEKDEGSESVTENEDTPTEKRDNLPQISRKELFDKLYREHLFEPKYSRKKAVYDGLRPHFKTDEEAKLFVDINFERKRRNMICRRIRMTRKANLQDFNYFVTFTYDDKLHTEESFRQKLKNCLSLLSSRKGWKYIGVWERSPGKKRLHFHGIFDIPEGTMPGYFVQKEDYSFNSHRRQITNQDTYFLENFGRNDFDKIVDQHRIGEAMAYLMKYLEKSGERVVYSKGLPQYFITDIMDEDIVCPIGMEEQKLLLFDDFGCWDEGEYIGQVSKETIAKMPKAN